MNDKYINERVKSFCENVEKNGSIKDINHHNIYFIQTEDIDGNITGEAFAANLTTQVGLQSFVCGYDNRERTHYIKFGTSSTAPTITDTAMTNEVSQFTISIYYSQAPNGTWSHWYDPTKRLFCTRCNYLSGSIDYNVSGINEDVDIYEMGLIIRNYSGYGAANNSLSTHSLIYDELGNVTHITKKLNEKLTVTVFLTFSEKIDMIESHYTNGEYVYFHPYRLAYRGNYGEKSFYYSYLGSDMFWNKSYVSSYSMHNMYDNYTYDSETNRVNPHLNSGSFDALWTDKHHYFTMQLMGRSFDDWFYVNSSDYFQIYRYVKSDSPENITCYDMLTNSVDSNSLSLRFGRWWGAFENDGDWIENRDVGGTEGRYYCDHKGCLPVTDFHMTSSKMYNYITKEWDIIDSFTDAPYADYSRYFRLCTTTSLPTYNGAYDPNDTVSLTYGLYVNPKNNLLPPFSSNLSMPEHIPITKMKLQTTRNMYATDTWWDSKTFQHIEDLNNIPQALQTKKYYLAQGGSAGYIEETRDQDVHTINCGGPYYNIQSVEPSDWSTNYTSYYTKNGNTYEQVTGAAAPTFVANTYYQKTDEYETVLPNQSEHVILDLSEYAYELLTEEPTDWGSNYTSYYERIGSPGSYVYTNITGAEAPTFATNTYYRNGWESGKFHASSNGQPINDSSWIRLRGYVKLPFNLTQITSMKCVNWAGVDMQIMFYDRDGKHYSFSSRESQSGLAFNDVANNSTKTLDINRRCRLQSAMYLRIAVKTTTFPTNTDVMTLDFYKSLFTSDGDYFNRGKLLRSNSNNWIALPDRILYPDAVGGPISIPYIKNETYIVTNVAEDSHDKFIPEMRIGVIRWATEDKLVIADISYNQLYQNIDSSASGLWPYNINVRIFDITSTAEYPSYVDIRFEFTDWNNDTAYNSYGITYMMSNKFWFFSTVDSTHAYLGCWNPSPQSKSKAEFIILKLYDVDENNIPKQIKLTDVWNPYMIDGTSYLCYYVSNSVNPNIMCVYDIENEEIIQTIQCPVGYSLDSRTICGVGNTMYFTAYDTSKSYKTFSFDITSSGGNPENLNTLYSGLIRLYSGNNVDRDLWLFSDGINPRFDYTSTSGVTQKHLTYKDILVTNSLFTYESIYNAGSNRKRSGSFIYTTDNPTPVALYSGNDLITPLGVGIVTSDSSSYGPYSNGWRFSDGQIQLSADGKHLLIVSTASYNCTKAFIGKPCVIDLGAQIDDTNNSRQGYMPYTFQTSTFYYGITEFHNMIYTIQSDGHLCRRELGRFLCHKVEGSTYTITSYNNPKYLTETTSLEMIFGIEANEN